VDRGYAATLEAHLIVLCRRLDVEPMQVRARRDRVDLLARIKPVHAVSEVARRLKRGSGELLSAEGSSVRWGRGYAAATVAPGEVRGWIRRYATGRTGGRTPRGPGS
jgi:REP element-mobilizing transposase RayT